MIVVVDSRFQCIEGGSLRSPGEEASLPQAQEPAAQAYKISFEKSDTFLQKRMVEKSAIFLSEKGCLCFGALGMLAAGDGSLTMRAMQRE
jgi:hypothetical protein